MSQRGLEAAGLDDVRGPGVSDPFITLDPAVAGTAYAGVGGAASTKTIPETGVYEFWGVASATVQPAVRSVFLTIRRGSFGRDLEYGHLSGGAGARWRSMRYLAFFQAGDIVEVTAGGGAVGDAGLVLVRWRRVGR